MAEGINIWGDGTISIWEGSIEEVLLSGEYDQGIRVLIDYDELFDLVEQAKQWQKVAHMVAVAGTDLSTDDLVNIVQRNTNRPLHPALGGDSPYSEFIPFDNG